VKGNEAGQVRSGRRVVELFAGVGGFRLGLEAAGWEVVWANQWEPSTKSQPAFDCYVRQFKTGTHVNKSITAVMDAAELNPDLIPQYDLVCGGFPCQDYSVAKTLSQAHGLEGKKGVLWWDILRLLSLREPPRFVFLENVDRLLKSPATQRGRDFAIILSCLADLGYVVEWRVVNAADYGFPQRRRRVFIIARPPALGDDDPYGVMHRSGVLARALPVKQNRGVQLTMPEAISSDASDVSASFGTGLRMTPFKNAGLMKDFKFWTFDVTALAARRREVLADVVKKTGPVPDEFFIPAEQRGAWERLKGAKSQTRTNKAGFTYVYNEGAVAFPDPLNKPSRTILTGEGGPSPSRFKHVVETPDGLRRLTPTELERLNGFPEGWTDTGMSDARRAFMMGNALVVGLIRRVGVALDEFADAADNHALVRP
jgi:DNA (cytosine-5)-methyltransferase 1